jgi:hypothetical protein
MIVPAYAEPAVIAVEGKIDRYIGRQAWVDQGLLFALGQWEHADSTGRRLYGESIVRSWPTAACTAVQWSPRSLVMEMLGEVEL